mgnify:CR=1 FL=1
MTPSQELPASAARRLRPAAPRVVAGSAGSDPAKRPSRWAAHFPAHAGADLAATATWELPTSDGLRRAAVPPEFLPEHETEKALTETIDEVFGSQRPTGMRLAVIEGHPAKVLVQESKGAFMLVVGSRGHGGFAGVLPGSVSASVAEHAKGLVVIVHGDQHPPEA